MNNTKDAMYCRLCAELKQHKTLTNLQTDEETCQKVVNKLSRFNIIMDFQENILPKTVCLLCVKSLERAFAFVTAVEQAQAFLSDFILVQINTAASDSCDENMLYEPPDNKNGIADFKDEHSQDSMEVNNDATNLSEKCDSEVRNEVYNGSDYSVINGNSEEHTFENKHDIQLTKKIIQENTDLKDEYVELLDLYHVEDNKKDILEEELNSKPILLDNTVSSADFINKQNYSNEGTKNIDKSVQKLQPQECNSEQIAPKRLSTTVYSKTNIDKKKKTKKDKQKTSNMSTKNTDTDVENTMSWKDYEWKCYYCKTVFPSIGELQTHSMQYHNSCNPYECTDCVTRSSNLKRFMKHVRKHKYYLHYSCYKCFKKFPKVFQAGLHRKKVHEDSEYVCSGCNTPFYSNSELKEHVNKYYKQFIRKKPDLTCSICNKNTENARDLRKHLLSHENKKDYVCETCGKCFATKTQLRAHMVLHSAVKILHTCDICNASFVSVNQLRYHKTIHSGIKPFTCDHCGKSYRTKSYIARHMKIHMDSFLYPCSLCNKSYSTTSNLKKHRLQHTGEKPFSCDICLRDFTDLSNRNKHMRRIHDIELAKKRQPIIKQQTPDDSTFSDLAAGDTKMVNQSA